VRWSGSSFDELPRSKKAARRKKKVNAIEHRKFLKNLLHLLLSLPRGALLRPPRERERGRKRGRLSLFV
jgi:intein/homing endonuclease